MKRLLLLTFIGFFLCDIDIVNCEPTNTMEDETPTNKEQTKEFPWGKEIAAMCLIGVIGGTLSFFYPFISGDVSSLSETLHLSVSTIPPSPRFLGPESTIGWLTRKIWEVIMWYSLW